jgi:hypothetical protein
MIKLDHEIKGSFVEKVTIDRLKAFVKDQPVVALIIFPDCLEKKLIGDLFIPDDSCKCILTQY